jgi:hypothetical protein
MSDFTPTPAERKKYADYSVEFRASECRVEVDVVDGEVYRFATMIRRVPSTKTFIVHIRSGATPRDRMLAELLGRDLPRGEWARMPDMWVRRRAGNGQVFFWQMRGTTAEDPLLALELEMLLENPLLMRSDIDRPRLLP